MASPQLNAEVIPGLVMPEEQALQERFAVVTPEHTIRGMFMTSTLECLRRAKGEPVVEQVAAAAGFTGQTWGMMKNVPFADFNRMRIEAAKALVVDGASTESAIVHIAGSAIDIFFESIAGRTMILLAGKDPHRLLGAAPNGYVLAVNDDGERSYEKQTANSGVFHWRHDLLGPCWQIGGFRTALKIVCGVDPAIHVSQTTLLDYDFHMSW
jgi:uncharacterized protein (TIGR02265 family)